MGTRSKPSSTKRRLDRTLHRLTRPPTDRPWVVIYAAGYHGLRAVTEAGDVIDVRRGQPSVDVIHDLANHSIYNCGRHTDLVRAIEGRATGHTWRSGSAGKRRAFSIPDRVSRLTVEDATDVYCVGLNAGSSAAEAFEAFQALAGWVRSAGAGMSSIGSITKNILRQSLFDDLDVVPLHLACDAIYNRKEARVLGEVFDVDYLDRSAAYPTAMRHLDVPLRMGRSDARTDLSGEGIARAWVSIPERYWSPLPFRYMGTLIWGWAKDSRPFEGVWTYADLRLAVDCEATVHRAIGYPVVESAPGAFGTWGEVIEAGRGLPGQAALFSKYIGNRAWSLFASHGRQGVRRWNEHADKRTDVLSEGKGRSASCPQISAFIDSDVRRNVYQSALAPLGDAVLYWDTDGGIVQRGITPPPGFRIKRRMTRVEIKQPQMIRWNEVGDPSDLWTYSTGGVPAEYAHQHFGDGKRAHAAVMFGDVYLGSERCVTTLQEEHEAHQAKVAQFRANPRPARVAA